MKYAKPKWYTDAGHGWLRVETAQIFELGVVDQISPYSYLSPDGKFAYLEEDSDATPFIEAYGRDKYEAEGSAMPDQYSHRSHIRDYPDYSADYVRERARFLGL